MKSADRVLRTNGLPYYVGLFVAIGILGLGLSSCDSRQAADDGKPDVVATSTIIADWTKEIVKQKIELTSILQP